MLTDYGQWKICKMIITYIAVVIKLLLGWYCRDFKSVKLFFNRTLTTVRNHFENRLYSRYNKVAAFLLFGSFWCQVCQMTIIFKAIKLKFLLDWCCQTLGKDCTDHKAFKPSVIERFIHFSNAEAEYEVGSIYLFRLSESGIVRTFSVLGFCVCDVTGAVNVSDMTWFRTSNLR